MYIKKIVLDNIRVGYNGVFSIMDFFESVESWKAKNGFDKDIKRHLEHTEPEGKKIEWYIELWKDIRDYARIVVRLRALFNDITEIEIKEGKRKVNKGEALTLIDGILVQDFYGRWQQKPLFYFVRSMIDKHLCKFHKYRFEAETEAYVQDLQKHIKKFFEESKKLK